MIFGVCVCVCVCVRVWRPLTERAHIVRESREAALTHAGPDARVHRYVKARLCRAKTYETLGKVKEAYDDYKRAMSYEPNNATARRCTPPPLARARTRPLRLIAALLSHAKA